MESSIIIAADLLLAPHRAEMLLEESGIRKEVVRERGYQTIGKKVELKEPGFSKTQRILPPPEVGAVTTLPSETESVLILKLGFSRA